MKHLTKIFAIALFASFILISCSQENKNDDHNMEDHNMTTKKDSVHQNTNMNNENNVDNSIVREGVIDLKSIDKNNDGKVFQDPMDWNVISDKAGKCPLCGMKLKEVSLEKAKENLVKTGFEVKE